MFIFIILLIFGMWLLIDNLLIQTTTISVTDKKIPNAFNNYRIVQISDLHQANFGAHQTRLIKAIKAANPDIIVITGDLIDSTNVENAQDLIMGINGIAPIYYVPGNHEAVINNYINFRNWLIEREIVVLEDDYTLLTKDEESINLIGLRDSDFEHLEDSNEVIWQAVDQTLSQIVSSLDSTKYTILLSHRPEQIAAYAANQVDLVLSGHAHGGQLRLPFVGALFAPDQGWLPTYSEGSYKVNDTTLIVSRGLGCSHIQLRINDRPELVVVVLSQD